MKNILLISYFYICLGICICQDPQRKRMLFTDHNKDIDVALPETYLISHMMSGKRSTALKRLPSWSWYYGKRSADAPPETRPCIESKNVASKEELQIRAEYSSDSTSPRQTIHSKYRHQQANIEPDDNVEAKDTYLQHVQPWMSLMDKHKTGIVEDYNDFLEDKSQIANTFAHQILKRNGAVIGQVASWYAVVGKRSPAWSITYGKRSPATAAFIGERAPFWSVTDGKRAPIWIATYGKRLWQ